MSIESSTTQSQFSIIPQPSSVEPRAGRFTLSGDTVVWASQGALPEAQYFANVIAGAVGSPLKIVEAPDAEPEKNLLALRLDPEAADLGEEGCRLDVSPEKIQIQAFKPAGLFYGCQTIRQLLPGETVAGKTTTESLSIPSVAVHDVPRFSWRGHLLDVSRHFFTVDEVKRSIDLLALHKLNRFHLHLTDDQGWRVEIKRYPKLTEVGAWRTDKDGNRYGGFYTQDDIREIVAYAAERHVVIVPEIELPGHSNAALASYGELGCTGGPYAVLGIAGIFRDVYCAGQETTYRFIENVMDEVMALFPSQYIHIGGDECPKESWMQCKKCQDWIKAKGLKDEHELQSYVIHHVDNYLAGRGRKLVGWDEILEGGLAPGAVVQSWRGVTGGVAAATAGQDVIMSPTSHCYLDYDYDTISLEKAYSYEPIPEDLPVDKHHHVLGLEGNMWTERVPDTDRYAYQTFPRMVALAEVAWSAKENRDWNSFLKRLEIHSKRLAALRVAMADIETAAGTAGATTAE